MLQRRGLPDRERSKKHLRRRDQYRSRPCSPGTATQDRPERELDAKATDVSFVRIPARHRNEITDLQFGNFQGLPIDKSDDRPQQQIYEYDEPGRNGA
jgi:hypothetical protein